MQIKLNNHVFSVFNCKRRQIVQKNYLPAVAMLKYKRKYHDLRYFSTASVYGCRLVYFENKISRKKAKKQKCLDQKIEKIY